MLLLAGFGHAAPQGGGVKQCLIRSPRPGIEIEQPCSILMDGWMVLAYRMDIVVSVCCYFLTIKELTM